MQYKVSPTDVLRIFKNDLVVQLWKEDGTRGPKLLVRVSNPFPFRLIWGNDELRVREKERFQCANLYQYGHCLF
jgi:hypothetical protein